MEERLQKVLAGAGVCSRRQAETLMEAGRVKVNGHVVKTFGVKVNPERDHIEVDGKPIGAVVSGEDHVYVMLHKPSGVVTTVSDPQGRRTVIDCLRGRVKQRVFPVGRLDYDSEGLLLLTSDGLLTHGLTHPSFEVIKSYAVRVNGIPSEKELQILRDGVNLSDGRTSPAQAQLLRTEGPDSWLQIKIHEGRNRQVRRMVAAVGYKVDRLVRTALGPVKLNGLPVGRFRLLTTSEVDALKQTISRK